MSRPEKRLRFLVLPFAACLGALPGGCPPQEFDTGTNSNANSAGGAIAPVADAGADISLNDFDENGFELVLFNGSKSKAGEGRPVEYEWSVGGRSLGKGVSLQTPLAVGAYRVTLTVFDAEDQLAQDQLDVVVSGKLPFFGIQGAGAKEAYGEAIARSTDGGLFAGANTIQVPFNTPTDVRLGGLDLEPGPRRMSFFVDSQPQFGTLRGESPNLIYTPNDGFNGWDSFEFHAEDGKNISGRSRIALIVGNAPPTPPPTEFREDEPPTGPGLPGELFSNDCSCRLFVVAPDTGAVRIVGGLGGFMSSLAFQSRDVLIGTDGMALYQINPETALMNPLVTLTKDGQPYVHAFGIEFDSNGTLWSFGGNEFATIDLPTGNVTVRGSIGGYEITPDPARDPLGKILIPTFDLKMLRFDPVAQTFEVISPAIQNNVSGLAYHTLSNRFIGITWPDEQGEWTSRFAEGVVQKIAVIDQAVSGIMALAERP